LALTAAFKDFLKTDFKIQDVFRHTVNSNNNYLAQQTSDKEHQFTDSVEQPGEV
jgi:hypothetical protein